MLPDKEAIKKMIEEACKDARSDFSAYKNFLWRFSYTKKTKNTVYVKIERVYFYRTLFNFLIEAFFGGINKKPKRLDGRWLEVLTDWIPSKSLRKKHCKLIADDRADIAEARFLGRKWLARWRLVWLYINWLRYLLAEPFAIAIGFIRKASAG